MIDHRYAGRFMARDYVSIREEHRNGQTLWTFTTVGHDRLKSAPAKVTRIGTRYLVLGAAWGAPVVAVQYASTTDRGSRRICPVHRFRDARLVMLGGSGRSTGANPPRASTASPRGHSTGTVTFSLHLMTRWLQAERRIGRATGRLPVAS